MIVGYERGPPYLMSLGSGISYLNKVCLNFYPLEALYKKQTVFFFFLKKNM